MAAEMLTMCFRAFATAAAHASSYCCRRWTFTRQVRPLASTSGGSQFALRLAIIFVKPTNVARDSCQEPPWSAQVEWRHHRSPGRNDRRGPVCRREHAGHRQPSDAAGCRRLRRRGLRGPGFRAIAVPYHRCNTRLAGGSSEFGAFFCRDIGHFSDQAVRRSIQHAASGWRGGGVSAAEPPQSSR